MEKRPLCAACLGVAALASIFLLGCGNGGDGSGTVPFSDIGAGLTGARKCTLAWGDYDNDGDLDLALTGVNGSSATAIYDNDQGAFTDIGAALAHVWSCSLAWGDYDNDGDLDLALAGNLGTGSYASIVYRNDGAGVFADSGASLVGVKECALAWGDYDNDGDLDLALAGITNGGGGSYVSKIYNNDMGTFTEVGFGLVGVWYCSLAWGDYDNDGDLDLALAGAWYDGDSHYESKIYRSDDGLAFTDIGAALPGKLWCSLAWGDYDNDGDVDLALAGAGTDVMSSKVYRNDGGGTFVGLDVGLADVGFDSMCSVAWGDCDNDGDLDLALAGQVSTPSNVSKVYRNDGAAFRDINAPLSQVRECSLAWGDFDNDGDLDLALAGRDESQTDVTEIYRNDGGVFNTAPAAPTGLGASYTGAGPYDVTFSWAASTDGETPQDGLSYNLRVGTTPGGDEIMSGMAITSPDERLIPATGNVQHNTSWTLKGLAPGDYYWSVQAIDSGFMGSAWAAEQAVTVP